MTRYNTFLTFFIIAIIAFVIFISFYIKAIFGLMINLHDLRGEEPDPFAVISMLFSPAVIFSGVILAITSLVYRIIGIVCVARNKIVSDGEKALWIIGFIFMGFITAIVFLIMAKGKQFVE